MKENPFAIRKNSLVRRNLILEYFPLEIRGYPLESYILRDESPYGERISLATRIFFRSVRYLNFINLFRKKIKFINKKYYYKKKNNNRSKLNHYKSQHQRFKKKKNMKTTRVHIIEVRILALVSDFQNCDPHKIARANSCWSQHRFRYIIYTLSSSRYIQAKSIYT